MGLVQLVALCSCSVFSLWTKVSAGAGLSRGQTIRALTSPLSLQQTTNIVQALKLFVKTEGLNGENAYMCAE